MGEGWKAEGAVGRRGSRRGRQKEEPRRWAGFPPGAVSHTVVHTFCLSVRASVCLCVVCLPYGGGRISDDASAGRDVNATLMHSAPKSGGAPAALSRRRPGRSRRRRGGGVCHLDSGGVPLRYAPSELFLPETTPGGKSCGGARERVLA